MHFIALMLLAMTAVTAYWSDILKGDLQGAVNANDVVKVRRFAELKNDTYSLRKDYQLVVYPECYERAIKNGNIEILELLLNAKLNKWDFKPTSDLISPAAEKGEMEMVILLLEKGLGPTFQQYNNDILNNRLDRIQEYINHGFFPHDGLLAVAAKNGKLDVLKIILVGNGSGYRLEEMSESMSAVTWLGSGSTKVENQILDLIETYALKNLNNMEIRDTSSGSKKGASAAVLFDSIYSAVRRNDVDRVRTFSQIKNETVSSKKNDHLIVNTECYEAAVRNGNLEILNLLLYTKLNYWDKKPSSDLITLAFKWKKMDILVMLLQKGVSPSYGQYRKELLENRQDRIQEYINHGFFPPNGLLTLAAKNGMLDMLKVILVGDGSAYTLEEMSESLNAVKWSIGLRRALKSQIIDRIETYRRANQNKMPIRVNYHLTEA